MKKIVSLVTMTAVAAGLATAEVKISNNFRIRPVIAEFNMGTEADTHTRLFDLDGVQGAKDTIKFDAKNDYAGVTLAIDNNLTGGKFAFDTYSGFLKFGDLTFTGGLYDSRIANRVTKDQNDLSLIEQNWGATYNTAKKGTDKYKTDKTNKKFYGNKKLGINANVGALAGVDSDNITAIEGTKAISFVADYMFADVAGGKLQLWAALNKAADEWVTQNDDGQTTYEVESAYAFRAAYTADAFAFDADLHLRKDTLVAAAFFSPLSIDNLSSVFGFTFAKSEAYVEKISYSDYKLDAKGNIVGNTVKKDESYTADDTYWAIDARARYAIDDTMAAGIYLNYTNVKAGDEDAEGVLDTVVNFNSKLNDTVTAFVEGEFVFLTNSDSRKAEGSQIAAQVGGIFTAGKGATLDAAIRATIAGVGADQDKDLLGTQISIPVCMRIKL
ncbi:hypothetical protein [uncultured Treponema sp.]|uniref:hypothetical protein n=1 Tax=uncultured Treponema sp. TaxID=162155 RepID=UPI0025D561C7|nr:hypothetical protein [uncultured Treponema sp.]